MSVIMSLSKLLLYAICAVILLCVYAIKYSIKYFFVSLRLSYRVLIWTIALVLCVSSILIRATRYYYSIYSFGGKENYFKFEENYNIQKEWLNSFKAARGAI